MSHPRPSDIAALYSAFGVTHASPMSVEEDYAIIEASGPAYVARSQAGAPTLLIPLSRPPGGVARSGGGFTLIPAKSVSFDYAGRRWEQASAALECTDSNLLNTFAVLCADIVQRVAGTAEEILWQSIVSWVDEWQALVGKKQLMTPEQQLGLWGELWVASQSLDPDLLMDGWRGPDRDPVDYFINGIGVEVKTSRRANLHHVSQTQVDAPVGQFESYLLSLWVAPDPIRGVSLQELLDVLMEKVADPPALLKMIGRQGYSPSHRNEYATRFLLLEPPRWYPASDVPRVRVADPGISNLRYLVSLDTDKAFDLEEGNVLWRRVCGVVPSFDQSSSYNP